ncbi:Large-conductance mechanosensitive channel [Folsomia candida]|uniref:Large-conductance mechanosensitive channel n=1 Tax=Folsomia candida TaxID=158441 RepID=A0A226D8Y8_FOLCA|nr:Large-conductance mechanosensitive channel [Folsomia candida]
MGLKEFFRDGSVVKGAAGYIIGNAFMHVVAVFTSAFVIPVFGIFGGIPEFKESTFTINNSKFYHGALLDAIVTFAIVGLVLYLCVILPFDLIRKYVISENPPEVRDCPRCFVEISSKASKCPYCTADIEPLWIVGEDQEESSSKYGKKCVYNSLSDCGKSTTLCCSRIFRREGKDSTEQSPNVPPTVSSSTELVENSNQEVKEFENREDDDHEYSA